MINICVLVLIVLIILFAINVILSDSTENFLDLKELEKPLHISQPQDFNRCNTDIPLVELTCNRVPNFPKGLEPETNIRTLEIEAPFHRLAPKNGKYTFKIPELKYDGIYSRNLNKNNKCCWGFNSNRKNETYGCDKLFHTPEKQLCGRTICSKPLCA
jgi:hypothetical protein